MRYRQDTITGLLTWPAYGTRLPGPARGRVEAFDPEHAPVPEPDPVLTAQNARSIKWPMVHLDDEQHDVVLADLERVASIRDFRCLAAVVAADHVHILLQCPPRADVPRLAQLIKGALSRALTVAAGDAPGRTTAGDSARHHKWWARQYVYQQVLDPVQLDALRSIIERHAGSHLSAT